MPVVRYARKVRPVGTLVSKRLTTALNPRVVPVMGSGEKSGIQVTVIPQILGYLNIPLPFSWSELRN